MQLEKKDEGNERLGRLKTLEILGTLGTFNYTFTVFHFPFLNSHSDPRPADVSAIKQPQNTPEYPQSSGMASA